MVKVDHTKSPNGWVNIYFNGILHLSIYGPSVIKVQTWLSHSPIWKKYTKYYIEITHKSGVIDGSDYTCRETWKRVANVISQTITNY